MISEVPLGAFLSGGVDSSAVVAAMAGLSADPVNTCSIAFADPDYDESAYAQQVADRYRTRHFVDRVESDDFDLVDALARLYDEPYADSSAMPTYRVCQLARSHVTVALSGDGGDESFGGYRRYRLHMMEERLRQPLPLALRRPMFGLLGRVYPKADWAPRVLRGKTTFEALARDSVEAYFHSMSLLRDADRRTLYSNTFRAELAGYNAIEVFKRHARRANHDDPLALIQYLDLKTYLVGDINTKVDRASMAHSLEVREPLMDHPLVEWLATLPSNFKLRGGEGKWLLKTAMEPMLPRDLLYRQKMGFAVPIAAWFRGPLKQRLRDAVLGERLADSGIFNAGTLRRLVDQHQSGMRDHSAPLWSLLMFEAFLRTRRSRAGGRPSEGHGMTRDVRILTFTSLYPSGARPRHGIFIESRLQPAGGAWRLAGTCHRAGAVVSVHRGALGRVRPHGLHTGGRAARRHRSALSPLPDAAEDRHGPAAAGDGPGRSARSAGHARPSVKTSISSMRITCIPTASLAASLARRLGRPFVVSARGSDVNVIGQMPGPRARIVHAIESPPAVIAVSAALDPR